MPALSRRKGISTIHNSLSICRRMYCSEFLALAEQNGRCQSLWLCSLEHRRFHLSQSRPSKRCQRARAPALAIWRRCSGVSRFALALPFNPPALPRFTSVVDWSFSFFMNLKSSNGTIGPSLPGRPFSQQLESDNGVAAKNQSLLALLAMVNGGGSDRYWTDTEVYRSKRGAQALSEAFGAALGGRGVSVNLQSPVVGVDVSGRKVANAR